MRESLTASFGSISDIREWPTALTGKGPLAGLRVLDLSRVLAGPFATMHLADLGADVIKIESPHRGDETRYWGPPFAPDGTASYFLAVNHNKRSLTLDLADPDGAAIAQHLAAYADVVIDNFLPGKLEKFGLDHGSLSGANPGIVTATISGFGTNNPYAGRPGFDFLAQAMGGMMAITGQPGSEPTRVGVAITDLITGLFIAIGVLSALNERHDTGVGRHVDVSLLDAQVASLVNIASGWLSAGVEPSRFGNRHPSIAPYETLSTFDRPIAIAVGMDHQFRNLVAALGVEALADDPRFRTNRDRVDHRGELAEALEDRLRTDCRDTWLEKLAAVGVPSAPVNSISEVFADPVVQERMVVDVDGTPQLCSPIRINGEVGDIHTAPPALGEDSLDILGQLGLSKAVINKLSMRHVI